MVSSAASSQFQAYGPKLAQVETREVDSRQDPMSDPEVDDQSSDEDDEQSSLVRRPLTKDEKKSVMAAYKLEKKKAIADARKQRRSEDQLTRGIYKRELAKTKATLQARTLELRAAKKAGTMSPAEIKRELEAARAAAELAREQSSRAKDDALKAATAMEDKAVQAAKAAFEHNCDALDQMTVADFESSGQ